MKRDEQKWIPISYIREFFPCNFEISLRQSDVFYKGWRIEVIDSITHRAAASESNSRTILDISSMIEIAADLMGRIKAGPTQLPETPEPVPCASQRETYGLANVIPLHKKKKAQR